MRWLTGLADLEDVTGVFISNELVDAMPVHLVVYRDGEWSELLVDICGQEFCFVPAKIDSPELVQALAKLPVPIASPYRTEVNLAATRWIQAVSARLEHGFVLIVDYGFPRDEYYKPERTEGTLSCYSRHRRTYNPLERPGEIDITAHVDFTSLAEAAEKATLKVSRIRRSTSFYGRRSRISPLGSGKGSRDRRIHISSRRRFSARTEH